MEFGRPKGVVIRGMLGRVGSWEPRVLVGESVVLPPFRCRIYAFTRLRVTEWVNLLAAKNGLG